MTGLAGKESGTLVGDTKAEKKERSRAERNRVRKTRSPNHPASLGKKRLVTIDGRNKEKGGDARHQDATGEKGERTLRPKKDALKKVGPVFTWLENDNP